MLPALATLLSFQLAGELLARLLGLPIPGPVLGFVGLFVMLQLWGRLPALLERTADGLLQHLSLLFVPAGVGVMVHAERLGREGLAIAAALVIGTALAIAVAALVFQWAARRWAPGAEP